jgi:hypothetical protein
MTTALKKLIPSNQMQLNILGFFLLALLGVSAWSVVKPLTWFSVLPLLFIGYAAFSIVFELTVNRANVPTLGTSIVGRRKIAIILQREISLCAKKNYTILDLGSGRGELTRQIAKRNPNAVVIGIERTRIPYWRSTFMQRLWGLKNLSYQHCDFWPFDCSGIDAVVFYLTPRIAERAGKKLQKELKPGSVVISYMFPLLGAWTPVEVLTYRAPFKETIYVYRK